MKDQLTSNKTLSLRLRLQLMMCNYILILLSQSKVSYIINTNFKLKISRLVSDETYIHQRAYSAIKGAEKATQFFPV